MGVVLNLFVWRDNKAGAREDQQEPLSLASLIRSQGHPSSRRKMLRSILLETERLSPPVVGVMRRVQRDVVLRPDARNQAAGGADHAVPAGNDIWLYLSGAARDPAVFGDDADLFRWDRYMDSGSRSHSLEDECEGETEGVSAGLAYGAGPKMCLGVDVVREVVGVVAEVMVEEGEFNLGLVDGEGKGGNALLLDKGVRGWLGWEAGVGAEAVARGMKQLPVQRPRRVINVRVGVRGRG